MDDLRSRHENNIGVKQIAEIVYDQLVRRKGAIVWVATFLMLAKIAALGAPLLLKAIVDGLTLGKSIVAEPLLYPPMMAIAYAACYLSATIFDELKECAAEKTTQPIIAEIARGAFFHLHSLPLSFYVENRSGILMRDVDRGLKALQSLASLTLHTALPTIVELLIVTIYLIVFYEPWVSAIILSALVMHIVFTVLATKRFARSRQELNEADSRFSQKLADSLSNFETIKLFGSEREETKQYGALADAYSAEAIKFQRAHSYLRIGQQAIIAGALGYLLWHASGSAMRKEISVGDFVLINALAFQLFAPIGFIGIIWQDIRKALVDVERIGSLLKTSVPSIGSVKELKDQHDLSVSPRITFKSVTFGYNEALPIVSEVSFNIDPGTTTGLVGQSGTGKTTILRLLLRLAVPQAGVIELDETRIDDFDIAELRLQIGVVPQEVVLFHGTIAYNIAYGKRGATMEQIRHAAGIAQLDQFIENLPAGYETQVGERGLKLSGGERQRLGIARALIRDPAILIFDEASSALDSETERMFWQAARKAASHRTCLVVSHRLSSVMHADQILVLHGGRIVEHGSHAKLVHSQGRYAKLWQLQVS